MIAPAGVIVTFWPDADFGARLAAIRREVDRLIVVDNTADQATQARLKKLCTEQGATFYPSAANIGLGAALNLGFSAVIDAGYHWAIAFDQDSTPEPGFGRRLMAEVERVIALSREAGEVSPERFAVLGANWVDEARPDAPARHLRPHPHIPALFQRVSADAGLGGVTCVITSGSLFHVPTWRTLGGFDAALFLDLVDTEYCLRAVRAGHAVRVAPEARLLHRRGQKRPVRFLGRTWWPAFMSPLRLRYLFRNRVLVARRHGRVTPHWVSFEIAYALKIVAEIVFLEKEKRAKLAACVRGTWEGWRGRTGKITEEKTSASRDTP